mmetsp:Transcript_44537/g.110834  ORF Transcript_44537/g.110834 Transcript_44537/m.110834 type:complete len:205 (+) Transcript_44537:372-986(+)
MVMVSAVTVVWVCRTIGWCQWWCTTVRRPWRATSAHSSTGATGSGTTATTGSSLSTPTRRWSRMQALCCCSTSTPTGRRSTSHHHHARLALVEERVKGGGAKAASFMQLLARQRRILCVCPSRERVFITSEVHKVVGRFRTFTHTYTYTRWCVALVTAAATRARDINASFMYSWFYREGLSVCLSVCLSVWVLHPLHRQPLQTS